jgi:hypothetical protein
MTRRHVAGFIAVSVLLSGCGQPQHEFRASSPAPELGRWIIIPAEHEPPSLSAERSWSVWRLDTKTGALDFCSYTTQLVPAGNGTMSPDIFTCSQPKQPDSD